MHPDSHSKTPSATASEPFALSAAAALGTGLVLSAPPGLTWLDAGELGAAAVELGVAHPPGFAAFVLGHKAVMLGVPLGDQAFRGNLASALMAGLAVWALAFGARALGLRAWAAALGALLAMAAPLAVLHGQTIEVYSGLGLWLGLLVGCATHGRITGDGRWALGAGLLAGLALGHHAELRLVVPLILVAGLSLLRRPRVLVGAVLAGILGGTVVVLLPLRSSAGLWRDWGHPADLAALWDHLSGLRIRTAFADRFFSLSLPDLTLFLEQTLWAAPLLAGLGLLGFLALARRPVGWVVAAVWLVDLLYSVGLNPMGLLDRQNGVLGLAALGIGAAASLDAAAAWLGARLASDHPRVSAGLVASLAMIFGLGGAVWAPDGLGARASDRGLPRLLSAALDEAPPEAVALVVSDSFAAGLAFAQVAEGARPDLAVIVRQHAWDASSVAPVRARLPHALPRWTPLPPPESVGVLMDQLTRDRPQALRWEWGHDLDAAARPVNLVPRFPWFAVTPAVGTLPDFMGALGRLVARSGAAGQSTESLGPEVLSPEAQRGLAIVAGDLGFYALSQEDGAGAVAALGVAAGLDPSSAAAQTNLSQARLRLGDVAGAVEAAEAAWRLAPADVTVRLNLARMLVAHRPTDGRLADLLVEIAVEGRAAQRADAQVLAGVLAGNRGDLAAAAAYFSEALGLVPGHAEAAAGMAQVARQRGAPR